MATNEERASTSGLQESFFKWDTIKIFTLISCFEAHPNLWDMTRKDYTDRIMKQTVWKKIARILDMPVAEVQRKMLNLKTQFYDELKRATDSAQEDTDDTGSNWKFYGALSFFKTEVTPTLSRDTFEMLEGNCSTESGAPICDRAIGQVRKKRKLSATDLLLSKACRILDEDQRLVDEYTTFGNFVASEIRQLKSTHCQKKLKWFIQSAILKISKEDDDFEMDNTIPLMYVCADYKTKQIK